MPQKKRGEKFNPSSLILKLDTRFNILIYKAYLSIENAFTYLVPATDALTKYNPLA